MSCRRGRGRSAWSAQPATTPAPLPRSPSLQGLQGAAPPSGHLGCCSACCEPRPRPLGLANTTRCTRAHSTGTRKIATQAGAGPTDAPAFSLGTCRATLLPPGTAQEFPTSVCAPRAPQHAPPLHAAPPHATALSHAHTSLSRSTRCALSARSLRPRTRPLRHSALALPLGRGGVGHGPSACSRPPQPPRPRRSSVVGRRPSAVPLRLS